MLTKHADSMRDIELRLKEGVDPAILERQRVEADGALDADLDAIVETRCAQSKDAPIYP